MRQLKDLAISDSGFLFDPYTGLTFSVNPSGKFLLEELRAGRDPSRLAPALRSAFELAEGDDPERDVAEFVVLLREHGLLPREEHR